MYVLLSKKAQYYESNYDIWGQIRFEIAYPPNCLANYYSMAIVWPYKSSINNRMAIILITPNHELQLFILPTDSVIEIHSAYDKRLLQIHLNPPLTSPVTLVIGTEEIRQLICLASDIVIIPISICELLSII